MRGNVPRIHDLFFMLEDNFESSRALREHIVRMHDFFMIEESVLKDSSVQTVPHLMFEKVAVKCDKMLFASTTCF